MYLELKLESRRGLGRCVGAADGLCVGTDEVGEAEGEAVAVDWQTIGRHGGGSCLRKSCHQDFCCFDGAAVLSELFVCFGFVKPNKRINVPLGDIVTTAAILCHRARAL